MNKETPAPSVVKDSTFKPKGGKNQKYFPFRSEKGTQPLNDVTVYDEKTREHIMLKGLTDDQKIAEGYQPPFAYENGLDAKGNPIGRFKKDSFDRKELNRIAKNRERITGWLWTDAIAKRHQPVGTLIVHLKNFRRGKDFKDFKTTHSFAQVKESEIVSVLSTIVRLDRNKKDDKVLNYVTKYYFNGKTIHGYAKA
jgi:hypothetical protein